jgi:catechol 2,3-dioxygenase-like lactoylglutathione lyase family enzyme
MPALNSVIVTTDDLDRAVDYYTSGLKLSVVERGSPEADTFARLWGLDGEYSGTCLVLKRRPEDQHGYLRLLHLEGAQGADIRGAARRWDWGIFDLAFVVTDNEAKVGAIERLGYEVHARPLRYDVSPRSGYYVKQSLVAGPNSILVSFIERFNARHSFGRIDPATGFSELGDSAQVVEDTDTSVRFYSELLGVPVRTGPFRDVRGSQNTVIGIPPEATFAMTLMGEEALAASYVELLSMAGLDGRAIPEQRSLLNYGLAALSFAVSDLDATYQKLVDGQVEILCAPIEADVPGVGTTRVLTCFAPSGIPCEIYQQSSTARHGG